MEDEQSNQDSKNVRRKLLKAVVYVPPVILGAMIATPRNAMGATVNCRMGGRRGGGGSVLITISSGTNACCPCVAGARDYNERNCCRASCGTNCPGGSLRRVRCRDFCRDCGFTPVGCRRPCTCQASGRCR